MSQMQIILLERVENLGQMGELVNVRPGYARNFLLPQKKALRATKSNIAYFEAQKAQLEKVNAERRKEAESSAKKLDGLTIVMVRQASESGQLYGSIAARDVVEAIGSKDIEIERRHVVLNHNIKTIGLHTVTISLHPEVKVQITLNIARSEEEAVQAANAKASLLDDEALAAEQEREAVEASAAAEGQAKAQEKAAKRAAKKAAASDEDEGQEEDEEA